MPLRVCNTLTGRRDRFQPLEEGRVRMFVCGPTVYEHIHVGHARTYVAYDIVARYLAFKGYRVSFIVNITDVDDKVFEKAKEEGVPYQEVAGRYTREFQRDLKALGVDTVTAFLRASDHVEESIAQVRGLLEKGYAYEADGSVYYDTSRFPEYGKLSHQSRVELKLRRLDLDPRKRSQEDFLLWRGGVTEEPTWMSPFGSGRPGWHIEDTAITISSFGPQYDVHGGAEELIYPHHEAEIAQAEALTGAKPFVRYWLHTGLLKVEGRKMSKSLGNYVTVKEILRRHTPDALRLYLASHHYRRQIDFREQSLEEAEGRVKRLQEARSGLEAALAAAGGEAGGEGLLREVKECDVRFCRAMDDDFNTPRALGALFSMAEAVKEVEGLGRETLTEVRRRFLRLLAVTGLLGQRGTRVSRR